MRCYKKYFLLDISFVKRKVSKKGFPFFSGLLRGWWWLDGHAIHTESPSTTTKTLAENLQEENRKKDFKGPPFPFPPSRRYKELNLGKILRKIAFHTHSSETFKVLIQKQPAWSGRNCNSELFVRFIQFGQTTFKYSGFLHFDAFACSNRQKSKHYSSFKSFWALP